MSNDLLSFNEVLSEYIDNIVISNADSTAYEPIQLSPLYWLLKYSNLHREYHKTNTEELLLNNLSFSIWNRFFYASLSQSETQELLKKFKIEISDADKTIFRELTQNEVEEIYFFITKGLRKYNSDVDIDDIKLALVRREFPHNFPAHSYWKNSVEIYNEDTQSYHDLLSDNYHDCDADFSYCILQSTEFVDLKFYGQCQFADSFFLKDIKFENIQFLEGVTLPEKYKRIFSHIDGKKGALTFCLEESPLPETFKEFTDQYLADLTAKEPKEIDGKTYNPAEYEPLYWFLVYDKLYSYYVNAVSGNIEIRHADENRNLDISEASGREFNKSIWNSLHYGHLNKNKLLKDYFSIDESLSVYKLSHGEIIDTYNFVKQATESSRPDKDSSKLIDVGHYVSPMEDYPLLNPLAFEESYFATTEIAGKNIFSSLVFSSILLESCYFDAEVSFNGTSIEKTANVPTYINDNTFNKSVKFAEFIFPSVLEINLNQFKGKLNLVDAQVKGNVQFLYNLFYDDINLSMGLNNNFFSFFQNHIYARVIFGMKSVKGADFKNNIFHKNASLELFSRNFQEKVSFANTDLAQISYLDLTNTNFEKGFDLSNVHYPKIEHPEVLMNRQADRFYDSYEILRNASKDYPMHEKDLFARGLRLWVYVKNYRDKKKHLTEDEQQKFAQEKVKRSQPLGMVVKLYDKISDCGQDITKPFLLLIATIVSLSNFYIFSSLYNKNFLIVGFTLAFLSIYAFSMAKHKKFLFYSLIAILIAGTINFATFFGQNNCNSAPLRLAVYDAIPFLSSVDNDTYQQTINDTILPKDRHYILKVKQECDYLSEKDCTPDIRTRELDLWELQVKEKYEQRRFALYPAFRFVGKLFSYLAIFLMILGIRHNTRMKE